MPSPVPLDPSQADTEALPSQADSTALPSPVQSADEPLQVALPKAKAKAKAKTAKSNSKDGLVLKRPAAKINRKQLPPPPPGHERLLGRGGVQVIVPMGESLGCKKCREARIGCTGCREKAGYVLQGLIWSKP